MGTTAVAPAPATTAPAPLTTQQKILAAAQDADQIAAIFDEPVATAIQAGIDFEPIIAGLVTMVIGLFKKKAAT